jgi:hypothetical protein
MYALYGLKTLYAPMGEGYSEGIKTLVATFDTYESAVNYVASVKLKNPIKHRFESDHWFKEKSLLGGYGYYEIENMTHIPRNPKP